MAITITRTKDKLVIEVTADTPFYTYSTGRKGYYAGFPVFEWNGMALKGQLQLMQPSEKSKPAPAVTIK